MSVTEIKAEIERAWDEEIARRAEAVRSGAVKGMDAGEFFAELDRRHPALRPVS